MILEDESDWLFPGLRRAGCSDDFHPWPDHWISMNLSSRTLLDDENELAFYEWSGRTIEYHRGQSAWPQIACHDR